MKKRTIFFMACLLAGILSFASCSSISSDVPMQADFIYNGLSTDWITSGGGRLYSRVQKPAQMIDLQTGKRYDLVRDPFFEEKEQAARVTHIFSDPQNFYYLLGNNKSSYRIIQQNHETLSTETIYQKTFYREQQDVFLGAFQTPFPDMGDIYRSNIPNRFAVFQNTLFLFLNQAIQAIDLTTRKETTILEESLYNGNYSYYQGTLYFISSSYDIYAYQIATSEFTQLGDYKAQALLVTPEGIYFSAANDEGRLHWINFNYQNEKVCTDSAVSAMDFNERYLYYLSEGDVGLYRMDLDGGENQKIYELPGVFDVFCLRGRHTNLWLYTDTTGNFAIREFDVS